MRRIPNESFKAFVTPANAPTWFALLRDDLELPPGSAGYVLDPRAAGDGVDRMSAAALVGELAR